MKFILALGIIIAACGTQAPADQTTALVAQKAATQETTTAPTAPAAGAPAIIQQADVAPGPECKAGGVRFMSWTDYAPDTSKDGTPTFTPGIDQGFASRVVCAGADGQDGKDGVGLPGKDGSDGAQGVAGADGAPGTDGEDAAALPGFQVVDGVGAVVGALAWVNPANSDYWVVKGDMRLQFSRTVGHFPYAYTFCSAADCTGTCKLAITNGVWANVFEIYETGAAVRATGRAQAASFAYASRRMGSSCANTPGSTTGLYDMAAPILGFAYPIVGAEAVTP